jgi:hypothetical protein
VVSEPTPAEWIQVSQRNARSVQTTIGWIFWDPGAVGRYEQFGLTSGLGDIAARAAPFAGAGPDALIAAMGSISELGIRIVFQLLTTPARFADVWRARNEAVREGLALYAPGILEPLCDFGPLLWRVAADLPTVGRPFAASHRTLDIPDDSVLSGWHAINFLREWRGDTHWAIVAAHGLSGAEASILHNAWLGYEGDWLSLSRGAITAEIDAAWASLENKGLARARIVNAVGLGLRQELEDATDRVTVLPWQLLGYEMATSFAERFEPPCEQLLARVDLTAGTNFQPASRIRARG